MDAGDRRYIIRAYCVLFVILFLILMLAHASADENVGQINVTSVKTQQDISQLNEEIRKLHNRIDNLQASTMTVIGDSTLEDIIMSGDLKISNLASGSGTLNYVVVDSNNALYKSVKVFP